jgi:hypothetical protein
MLAKRLVSMPWLFLFRDADPAKASKEIELHEQNAHRMQATKSPRKFSEGMVDTTVLYLWTVVDTTVLYLRTVVDTTVLYLRTVVDTTVLYLWTVVDS